MGLNKTLLTYTIAFNIINGLLFIYATTNPGGEVGMQMYFGFLLFYVLGLMGLIIIGLRNRKDFGRGKLVTSYFLHSYSGYDYCIHDCRTKSTPMAAQTHRDTKAMARAITLGHAQLMYVDLFQT